MRGVAEKLDVEDTSVADIMTTPVFTVRDETPLAEAIAKMAAAGTRRLVVTAEGDRLAGILTLDDILAHLAQEGSAISKLVEKQQPSVPA